MIDVMNPFETGYRLVSGDELNSAVREAAAWAVAQAVSISGPRVLPFADPLILGEMWNNNGVVTVSAGVSFVAKAPPDTVMQTSSTPALLGTIFSTPGALVTADQFTAALVRPADQPGWNDAMSVDGNPNTDPGNTGTTISIVPGAQPDTFDVRLLPNSVWRSSGASDDYPSTGFLNVTGPSQFSSLGNEVHLNLQHQPFIIIDDMDRPTAGVADDLQIGKFYPLDELLTFNPALVPDSLTIDWGDGSPIDTPDTGVTFHMMNHSVHAGHAYVAGSYSLTWSVRYHGVWHSMTTSFTVL